MICQISIEGVSGSIFAQNAKSYCVNSQFLKFYPTMQLLLQSITYADDDLP